MLGNVKLVYPLLLLALAGGSGAFALGGNAPLHPLNDEPPYTLPAGSTRQMWRDWSAPPEEMVAGQPDHSFRSIWVRMFPLVSVPLGDPYPDTVNYNALALANSGSLKVYALGSARLLGQGKNLSLDFAASVLKIDGKSLALQPFWITPVGSQTTTMIWDAGKKTPTGAKAEVRVEVRGGLVIEKTIHAPKDRPETLELWSAINVLAMNDYLKSVVPSEVIASWNRETLRAQAIAARTYGMYEMAMARARGQDFDVDPSTWFQSYQGASFWDRDSGKWRNVELASTTDAVVATKGNVILYQGEVIKAYFSSNSGGRTCTVRECLELDMDPGYIQEIDDHPQVRGAPGGTWGTRANLTPQSIKQVLLSQGINPPSPVQRLAHLERGPSGRTWRLRVYLQNKSSIDLDRQQTRKIMHLFGPIRSFWYQLGAVDKNGKQSIVGYGYGHAVGMSQWGAQLYAKDGWSASKILQHYYHQVTIKDLTGSFF